MFCLQQDLLQRQNVPKTEETAEKDEWDRQGNENTPPPPSQEVEVNTDF